MPAHTRSTKFIITLWRGSDVLDAMLAPDGYAAQKAAISMIEDAGALQAADRLTISEDPLPDDTLPEPNRSSHYS